MDPSAMVETSWRSRASIQFEVDGPAGTPRELVTLAVGMTMYTDGDELFWPNGQEIPLSRERERAGKHLQGVIQNWVDPCGRVEVGGVCRPENQIDGSGGAIKRMVSSLTMAMSVKPRETYMLHVVGHGSTVVEMTVFVVYVVIVAGTVAVVVWVFVTVTESVSVFVMVTESVSVSVTVTESVSVSVIVA